MNLTINKSSWKNPLVVIFCILAVSLVYSRFMVTVCTISTAVYAIYLLATKQVDTAKSTSNRPLFLMTLCFAAVLFSGVNSADLGEWWNQVRVKLPFLVLPLSFLAFPTMKKADHRLIHLVFISVLILSTFYVALNFYANFDKMILAIGKGQSIPTPVDHIHYSLFLGYGSAAAFLYALLSEGKRRALFALAGVYLLFFVHFLAVRTGIAVAYGGLLVVVAYIVLSRKQYLLGAGLLAGMIILPVLAVTFVPSLNKKMHYMKYDWEQYKKGEGNNYNDSERLMSYAVAWDLFTQRPLLGTGIGDLKTEMKEGHLAQFGSKEKYIYPHNQYLFLLSGIGIVLTLLFLLGLYAPLAAALNNPFLWLIFTILSLAFLVENTIQRAVSTAFFTFFILLNYRLSSAEKE